MSQLGGVGFGWATLIGSAVVGLVALALRRNAQVSKPPWFVHALQSLGCHAVSSVAAILVCMKFGYNSRSANLWRNNVWLAIRCWHALLPHQDEAAWCLAATTGQRDEVVCTRSWLATPDMISSIKFFRSFGLRATCDAWCNFVLLVFAGQFPSWVPETGCRLCCRADRCCRFILRNSPALLAFFVGHGSVGNGFASRSGKRK